MESCDVLIIGGGPAGSSCAWKLAGSGLDVLVMDKKGFPRDKPCAGWITPALVDELHLDLDDYRCGPSPLPLPPTSGGGGGVRGRVLEPITTFAVSLMGGPEVEATYDRPISYGIRRCEFDHYLLLRSKARLRLGEAVKSLERGGDKWIVNGTIEARVLVGAGGHFCPVARLLGPRAEKGVAVIAAQEIEVELTADQLRGCRARPGVPYLAFCPDLKGYGWYFRKGNFLNVGLGREDDRQLSDHVAAYFEALKQQGKIPRDLSAPFKGHAYLLYPTSARPLVGEGVLLAGDAAGMAYSPSGEGIRPAVETGLLAAEVIASAAGDYRRERLEPYRARVAARFGRRPAPSLTRMMPDGLKRALARRLMRWRWFARRVVVDSWFLRSHEPALRLNGQPARA